MTCSKGAYCNECDRHFGGTGGHAIHFVGDKCGTDRQLKAKGLSKDKRGFWVRQSGFPRQSRLWDGRSTTGKGESAQRGHAPSDSDSPTGAEAQGTPPEGTQERTEARSGGDA